MSGSNLFWSEERFAVVPSAARARSDISFDLVRHDRDDAARAERHHQSAVQSSPEKTANCSTAPT
jgi:hypothetical protein